MLEDAQGRVGDVRTRTYTDSECTFSEIMTLDYGHFTPEAMSLVRQGISCVWP